MLYHTAICEQSLTGLTHYYSLTKASSQTDGPGPCWAQMKSRTRELWECGWLDNLM